MKKSNSVPTLEMLSEAKKKKIRTIGNDVGDRFIHYCAYDAAGVVLAEGKIPTRKAAVRDFYAGIQACVVGLETGQHSSWIYHVVKAAGHEVIVANARKLQFIFRSSNKNDRRDAQQIGKFLLVDRELLSPVYMPSARIQEHVAILRARDGLVRTRTRLITMVRSLVKQSGERLPACSAAAFAGKALPLLPEHLSHTLGSVLEQIAALTQRIRAYDKMIVELIEQEYPQAKILMQIKGVGPLTALAYVLRIVDPSRFSSSRSLGPYVGLVPKLDQSGNSDPQLGITREGDMLLRRYLVSAAQYILGPFGEDSDLRRAGMRIIDRGGRHAKKRAVIAVARKLAVLMHRLWITDAVYEPLRNANRQEDMRLTA